MSEGSLGNLRWLIEIDDRAALAKLDNIDARVRELGARMASVMGGSPVSGAPGSTFGGGFTATPNPSGPGVAPGVAAAAAAAGVNRPSPSAQPSAYEMILRSPVGQNQWGNIAAATTALGAPAQRTYGGYWTSPPNMVPNAGGNVPPGTGGGGPWWQGNRGMGGGGPWWAGNRPTTPMSPAMSRFLGPPNAIGLLMSGMFGGWEIAKAYSTGQIGETAMGLASTDIERMQASTQMIQGQYGGVFGSSIGMFQDLFGSGPSALLRQNMSNVARVEASQSRTTAQVHLANVQRITGFGRTGEGAILRREAAAIGEYNLLADKLAPTISADEQTIRDRGTHFVQKYGWMLPHVGTYEPNVTAEARDAAQSRLGAARANLSAAGAALADAKGAATEQLAAYRLEQQRTGAEIAATLRTGMIGNRLALASVGATPIAEARAQLQAIQSGAPEAVGAVARQTFGAGFMGVNAFVLGEVGRQQGLIAQGRENLKQALLDERQKEFGMGATYFASLEVLGRNPRGAQRILAADRRAEIRSRFGDKPHEFMREMSQAIADEDLMEQSFKDQDRLLDINTRGTRRQLQYLLAQSPNPIGAGSDRAATAAVTTIERLQQEGLTRQAANVGVNALLEQKFIRQDYLDSFRAVQFDLRENAISPRDQEDPTKILSSIDESVLFIKDAMSNLSVEQ